MLRGTLERIVLAIVSLQPAYGYQITARLPKQGFTDYLEEFWSTWAFLANRLERLHRGGNRPWTSLSSLKR